MKKMFFFLTLLSLPVVLTAASRDAQLPNPKHDYLMALGKRATITAAHVEATLLEDLDFKVKILGYEYMNRHGLTPETLTLEHRENILVDSVVFSEKFKEAVCKENESLEKHINAKISDMRKVFFGHPDHLISHQVSRGLTMINHSKLIEILRAQQANAERVKKRISEAVAQAKRK